MKLSKNFKLSEFTRSQTATRHGINNEPTLEHKLNIALLTSIVLQPLRDKLGTITISSGYRSENLNRAIGGSVLSQHCKGQAADIEVPGMSNYDLAVYIESCGIEYDQLILEFPSKDDPRAGWVHVSYNSGNNRKVSLTATREQGKTFYKKGISI